MKDYFENLLSKEEHLKENKLFKVQILSETCVTLTLQGWRCKGVKKLYLTKKGRMEGKERKEGGKACLRGLELEPRTYPVLDKSR